MVVGVGVIVQAGQALRVATVAHLQGGRTMITKRRQMSAVLEVLQTQDLWNMARAVQQTSQGRAGAMICSFPAVMPPDVAACCLRSVRAFPGHFSFTPQQLKFQWCARA